MGPRQEMTLGNETNFDATGFDRKHNEKSTVNIRAQQRNGRKWWTIVEGFPESVRLPKSGMVLPVDFEKMLRALKKSFQTNGVLKNDEKLGIILQLQGDIRSDLM